MKKTVLSILIGFSCFTGFCQGPIFNVPFDGNLTETVQNTQVSGGNYTYSATINRFNELGKAANFSGAQYLQFSSGVLPVGNESYSVSVWVKNNGMWNDAVSVYAWGTDAQNQMNAFRFLSQGLRHFWYANDIDVFNLTDDNNWHHYVFTWDGTTQRIYFDGVEVANRVPSSAPNVADTELIIGWDGLSSYQLTGGIDDFEVYDYAISSSQVANLYGFCPTGSVSVQNQAQVNALAACTHIMGDLTINPGGLPLDLSPLDGIERIDGSLIINNLSYTDTLAIFPNLEYADKIYFSNTHHNVLMGFNNLVYTKLFSYISNLNVLTIDGFHAIDTIGNLTISNVPELAEINAFDNLNYFDGGDGSISTVSIQTTKLHDLNFISSVSAGVEMNIYINNNDSLTDITGFNGLNALLFNVGISDNSSLSVCSVDWVCSYLDNTSISPTITGNATGCETLAAVEAGCVTFSIDEQTTLENLVVYPNPTENWIQVKLDAGTIKQVKIISMQGQVCLQATTDFVDVRTLPAGVYQLLALDSDGNYYTRSFVKK